jgi:hypothetical protein
MAGHGPAPKPRDQRARRNKDPIPLRVIHREPDPQPPLPNSINWNMQTVIWWASLASDPLSSEYSSTEWNYLLDTAVLHHAFWEGDMKVAGELRLRAAKFGLTPEDRARLRIQVVTAAEIEDRASARGNQPSSRGRYQAPGASA